MVGGAEGIARRVGKRLLLLSLLFTGSGSKSATGLMEWSEADGAMDAFVMANHQTIYSSSEYI